MGTYKVIQDIEAEDKLFGPFSLRQFIYLIIVIALLFLAYKAVTSPVWFLVFVILPFLLFFGLLALPFGREQSSEVWLLAKIRFAIKPRVRIWDQTGAKEFVTITAPKVVEKNLTKNLSQIEVKSRLQALANTIDSRGWAVKNVDAAMFTQPGLALAGAGSDRLLNPGAISASANDPHAADDMFEASNTTTRSIDQMMQASNQSRRDQIVAQMKQTAQAPPSQPPAGQDQSSYWFLSSQDSAAQPTSGQPAPSTADEQALLAQLHATQNTRPPHTVWNHLKTIKPIAEQQAEAAAHTPQTPVPAPEPAMTPAPDPAILGLAHNDDLNVATIAHEANKARDKKPPDDDEVVISLH